MLKETKQFSALKYQEELIERLSEEGLSEESTWIYFRDSRNKIWKIDSKYAEFIDQISIYTMLPNIIDEIIAVGNIQEKEILFIDIESHIYNKSSELRKHGIPVYFKCLTLKGNNLGLVLEVLPSYISNTTDEIEEVNMQKLIQYLQTGNKE